MFHKIENVQPLADYSVMVWFAGGTVKIYDLKPLMEEIPALRDPSFYRSVKADTGGYGIVWNNDADLSSEEIFENGKTV